MARMVTHCMDCEHSIFCSGWSEYKCRIKECRIYEPEKEARKCKDFKKKTSKVDDDESKCHCKVCRSMEESE